MMLNTLAIYHLVCIIQLIMLRKYTFGIEVLSLLLKLGLEPAANCLSIRQRWYTIQYKRLTPGTVSVTV